MSWMDDLPDKLLIAEHEAEAKNTRKVLGVKSARPAPNTAQRAANLLRRGPNPSWADQIEKGSYSARSRMATPDLIRSMKLGGTPTSCPAPTKTLGYRNLERRLTPASLAMKRARRKGVFSAPAIQSTGQPVAGAGTNPFTPGRQAPLMGLEMPTARREEVAAEKKEELAQLQAQLQAAIRRCNEKLTGRGDITPAPQTAEEREALERLAAQQLEALQGVEEELRGLTARPMGPLASSRASARPRPGFASSRIASTR